MKNLVSLLVHATSKIIGRKKLEKLLVYSAKNLHVNLYLHGLIQVGGVSSYDSNINGEQLFIENILPGLLTKEDRPVFFDVGANIGDYTLELRRNFPKAFIHSFEPVKKTFDILAKNVATQYCNIHNIGFGNSIGTGKLFNTVDGANNTIASAYKEVFQEIFKKSDELSTIDFHMDTLDNFCDAANISHIDFLKIDVEGHELAVLRGATNLLAKNGIKIIQFEFNAHNVHSRVFLRDFYLTLPQFEFYRVLPTGLTKLGPYSHKNEIFELQNIITIPKNKCHLIPAKYLTEFYS